MTQGRTPDRDSSERTSAKNRAFHGRSPSDATKPTHELQTPTAEPESFLRRHPALRLAILEPESFLRRYPALGLAILLPIPVIVCTALYFDVREVSYVVAMGAGFLMLYVGLVIGLLTNGEVLRVVWGSSIGIFIWVLLSRFNSADESHWLFFVQNHLFDIVSVGAILAGVIHVFHRANPRVRAVAYLLTAQLVCAGITITAVDWSRPFNVLLGFSVSVLTALVGGSVVIPDRRYEPFPGEPEGVVWRN